MLLFSRKAFLLGLLPAHLITLKPVTAQDGAPSIATSILFYSYPSENYQATILQPGGKSTALVQHMRAVIF
jgi:hypothetical protein